MRILAIEIFKKDIFKPESNAKISPFDIIVNACKTTKFDNKQQLSVQKYESITDRNKKKPLY